MNIILKHSAFVENIRFKTCCCVKDRKIVRNSIEDENNIYFFGARSAKFFSTEPLHMSSPFEMTLKLLIFKPKSEKNPMVNFFEYQSSKSLNGVKKKKNLHVRRA